MLPVFGINQLGGDPHPVARLLDTAFQNISNPELPAYLLNLDRLSFVRKRRVSGNDKEFAHLGQGGDDILRYAIGEIPLLRVAAHIIESKYGYGRLIR
jgi:hypothetical protein